MISIIMPAYNSEKYIEKAILSVCRQDYIDWELIVIDDCSTDSTAEIVKKMAKSDSRIRYIKNSRNRGVAKSRNRGIASALGEWIAFLDSDDCWSSDKLSQQMNCALQNHAHFIFSGSAFMDQSGRKLQYYLRVPKKITFYELLKQNIISCSSVLIKKELLEQYPMRCSKNMHEDFAVWLQILRDTGEPAYGVNRPLLIYRITPGSKSNNKIKAACMTYRVYRYIGLSSAKSLWYWMHYSIRSLKKYSKIKGRC